MYITGALSHAAMLTHPRNKILLCLVLLFCSTLLAVPTALAQIQLGSDLDGVSVSERSGIGNSISMSADGNTVAIGAPGKLPERVRVHYWSGTLWSQLGSDIVTNAGNGDWFGYAVALSADGNRVAIGAYTDNTNGSNSGRVEVYEWDGNAWNKLGANIYGYGAEDLFGTSLSISANGIRVAIGADGSARARVYEWDGSEWIHLDGYFGSGEDKNVSLSADGSRMAIGDPLHSASGNGNWSGQVRVFEYDESNWIQVGANINGETSLGQSGRSVSLSANGNRVAIGAPSAERDPQGNWPKGHVQIFEWIDSVWTQVGANIVGESGQFGTSISMSADGNRIASGAPLNGGNGHWSGHVRVYEWSGSIWKQIGTDIDGEAAEDRSGTSVSLSADGRRVAIGAPYNDGNVDSSGHVRVFSNPLEEIFANGFEN